MTEEENMWLAQIGYNNSWPKQTVLTTQAATLFMQRMLENGLKQILAPVVVDKDDAMEAFKADKQIAKIYTCVLDVYDMLPQRPDLAFDAAWRTFEYAVETYANVAWSYKDHPFVETVKDKLCQEVLCHLSDKEMELQEAFSMLFEALSLNSIQFAVNRIFYEKQLSVATQTHHVYDRAKDIIDKSVLEHIRKTYAGEQGYMDAKAIRDISRRIYRLMNNQDADFQGLVVKPLDMRARFQMLINVILYTSRCERFHGDIYSPFRSTRTKMDTFYNYYFLTLASYILFWSVLHKLLSQKHLPLFVTPASIKACVKETVARMNEILPNDVK